MADITGGLKKLKEDRGMSVALISHDMGVMATMTNEGAAAWLTWSASLMSATATAVDAIRQVVTAKTAEAAGICRQTMLTVKRGKHVAPWTIGMIARALNVDITETQVPIIGLNVAPIPLSRSFTDPVNISIDVPPMRKMTWSNSVIVRVMDIPVNNFLLVTSLNMEAKETAATNTPISAQMAGM